MKLHKFFIFLLYFCTSILILTSCGGGGGGGGGGTGGGGVTPTDDQIVGIPDFGSMDQSIPVQQDLESLSYEDLASNLPQDTKLTPETFDQFLETYLKKKNLFVTEDDKKSLKEKFFGGRNGTLDLVDIDDLLKKNISPTLANQLPNLETLEKTTDMSGLMDQVKLSDGEVKEASQGLKKVLSALPNAAGTLDKNGDGKVDVRDFMRIVHPKYDSTLTSDQIRRAYYYWTYFVDIQDDWFKTRMWQAGLDAADSDFAFPPPIMIFPKQILSQDSHRKIIILDFRKHLILKLIPASDAETLLKKCVYSLPFKVSDISQPIYMVSAIDHASSTDITVDKVIIQHDLKDGKPVFKMTFWIKDNNPLKKGALVLTPSMWLKFKTSTQTSSRELREIFRYSFSIPKSWAADPEMVTPLEALDPGFAWQEVDKILKDIGLDIPSEQEAASSDFSSSNFTPPLPVSIAADFVMSRTMIESEYNRIEKRVMELINNAQSCGNRYNSSNECNLDQLLDSLFKLNIHIEQYMKFIYLHLIDVRNLYDDLIRSQDNVLDNKIALQKEYEFDMKALVIAQILEFALTAVKSTAQTIMEKIGETYAGGVVESGIEFALQKLADMLDLFSSAVAKAGASKAAVNLKKIAEFARHLAKVENIHALHKGMSLMMSFGVGLMKEYVKEAHDKAATLVNNSLTTLDANANYQLALIAHFQDFYDLLEEKEDAIDKLMEKTGSVLSQTISNRFSAQKACKANHEKVFQEFKEEYEQDVKDLEESIKPEEKLIEKARQAFDQFKQACDHQLFKMDIARDSMKTNCIETFDDSGCKRALARVDEAQKIYSEKMKCSDPDAAPIHILNELTDRLEAKKKDMEIQKANLKQVMNDNIAVLDDELAQCRESSVKGCSSPSLTSAEIPALIEQFKTKNIMGSFTKTREVVDGLTIVCASNIVKVFPPGGTFTSCQSAYNDRTRFSVQNQTTAYIILDQPIEAEQVDRSSSCSYWSKTFNDAYGPSIILSADKRLIYPFTAQNIAIWPYEGLFYSINNGIHRVYTNSCYEGGIASYAEASHSDAIKYAMSKCYDFQSLCKAKTNYFNQPGAFSFPDQYSYQGVAAYQIDVSIYNEAVTSTSKTLLAKQTFSVPQGYCDDQLPPPTPELVYMSYEKQDSISPSKLGALEFFFSNQIQPRTLDVLIENVDTGQTWTRKGDYSGYADSRAYVGTYDVFKVGQHYQISARTVKDVNDHLITLNYIVTLSTGPYLEN